MKFRPVLPRWAILAGTALIFVVLILVTQVANAEDSVPTATPTTTPQPTPIFLVLETQYVWYNSGNMTSIQTCHMSEGIAQDNTRLFCEFGVGESFTDLVGYYDGPILMALSDKLDRDLSFPYPYTELYTSCSVVTGFKPEQPNHARFVIALFCGTSTDRYILELGDAIFSGSPEGQEILGRSQLVAPTPEASPEATNEPTN